MSVAHVNTFNSRFFSRLATGISAGLMFLVIPSVAQIPLATAVMLARNNSVRLKVAEDDLRRARSVVSETKDAFVPSLVLNGGVGDSYGITLSVPTILTVNAQSLVYSSAQQFYLRAARLSLQAAALALEDTRQRVEEDAVLTYVSLDTMQETMAALANEYEEATLFKSIVQKRLDAGLESQLDMSQAQRQVLAARLQQLQMDVEYGALQEHLGSLTGLASASIRTVPDSIPSSDAMHLPDPTQTAFLATASERAADTNANARQLHAEGDDRYRWRPQVSFAAQYGRVSPVNDVNDYYNLHGKYNVAFVGVQIQLPIFDAAHQARSNEAHIDAQRATYDATLTKTQQTEDRLKLLHSLAELAVRTQIAEVDTSIATEQLKSVTLQASRGGDGGPVVNPKDESNARLRVRQRALDLLDASLQLKRAQVSLLRMTGQLDEWLKLPKATSPGTARP